MTQESFYQEQVREFHETFGHHVDLPFKTFDSNTALQRLRLSLISEEFHELMEAMENGDPVEILDAICDLLYVIHGLGVILGLPVDEGFKAVHASNMSKLGPDGKPIFREDGKVLKGPGYFKVNLLQVMNDAGWFAKQVPAVTAQQGE